VDHSKAMAKALDRHDKDNELVIIKGANHELERESDRVKVLEKIEAFLAANLGAAG
jgi:dipeptidyl aminopeptidase/acylaminoacyl peptidase